MYIGIIFDSGDMLYINESRKKLTFVDSISNAFNFKGTLEFKVSVKQWGLPKELGVDENVTFVSVCDKSLTKTTFDINAVEIDTTKVLRFNDRDFRKLMKCGITCSHWLYDVNDNWIAFPKNDDFDKIAKIRYLRRGLVDVITSHDNWEDRYDKHSWHPSYEGQHSLMLNPIIQQISLLNQDSCHEFTIVKS
ncbi:MAG: hypothetical protein ACEPOW_14000 [Bacteroidales bacterium]